MRNRVAKAMIAADASAKEFLSDFHFIDAGKAAKACSFDNFPSQHGETLDHVLCREHWLDPTWKGQYPDVRMRWVKMAIEYDINGTRTLALLESKMAYYTRFDSLVSQVRARFFKLSTFGEVVRSDFDLFWFVGVEGQVVSDKNGIPILDVIPKEEDMEWDFADLKQTLWHAYVGPCLTALAKLNGSPAQTTPVTKVLEGAPTSPQVSGTDLSANITLCDVASACRPANDTVSTSSCFTHID